MMATAASTPTFGATNITIGMSEDGSELLLMTCTTASVTIHPTTNTVTPATSLPVGGGARVSSTAMTVSWRAALARTAPLLRRPVHFHFQSVAPRRLTIRDRV